MLRGNFFELASVNDSAGKLTAVIHFDKTHEIFQGHFPGQPVVPGVCMIQMVKEILVQVVGNATRLEVADLVKFLTVIDPRETSTVYMELIYSNLENDRVKISATLFNEEIIYFKMRGTFLVSRATAAGELT